VEAAVKAVAREAERDSREAVLCTLAATRDALTAELVARLDAFDQAEGWAGFGIRSIAHWASIYLGLSSAECQRLLRLARWLRELPDVAALFSSGALSTAKAVAIARVATPKTQEWWLNIAREGSASQVERIAAAYIRTERDDSKRDDVRVRSVTRDGLPNGLVRIVADLEADEAGVVWAAIEAHAEAAWRADRGDPGEAPPDPYGARVADAFLAAAETALEAGPTPLEHGDPHTVVVHVDLDVLAGRTEEGRCSLETGPLATRAVSRDTAVRLACDAAIRVLYERDGRPVWIGSDQYQANRRQRRALLAHYAGCAFPGCGRRKGIHMHHIVAWPAGPTTLDNLVPLCRFHHACLHEGGYTIKRPPDRPPVFLRPDGKPVKPPPATPPDPTWAAPLEIDRTMTVAKSGGAPFDLGLTLDSLFSLN
jgi:hypothetical protein